MYLLQMEAEAMIGNASGDKFHSRPRINRFQIHFFLLISTIFICLPQPAYPDQVTYSYDDLGRLESAQYADGYNITKIGYQYDNAGNIEEKEVTTEIQDTDGDEMPDAWETLYGLDPDDASDAATDSDGDGLNNLEEYQYKIDPTAADSDGDGYSDGVEISYGSDPLDTSSCPPAETVPAVGLIGMSMTFLILAGLGLLRKRRYQGRFFIPIFIGFFLSLSVINVNAADNGSGSLSSTLTNIAK